MTFVARMSAAKSGSGDPACRFAHTGYEAAEVIE
jgi:hypothetical protein